MNRKPLWDDEAEELSLFDRMIARVYFSESDLVLYSAKERRAQFVEDRLWACVFGLGLALPSMFMSDEVADEVLRAGCVAFLFFFITLSICAMARRDDDDVDGLP